MCFPGLGTSATLPEKTLASSYGKKEGKGVKSKEGKGKRKEITSHMSSRCRFVQYRILLDIQRTEAYVNRNHSKEQNSPCNKEISSHEYIACRIYTTGAIH